MPYDTKHCVILLLFLMKPMIADRQPKLQNDASCPRPRVGKCSCEQIGPYSKVRCKGLDALPEKLPRNTTHIKITDGNIKEIPDNYFLPLEYLQSLELRNNKISNRFRLPQDLWSLDLGGNMLNSSSLYGMFDGLSKLRRLDISFNPIKEHLVPGTFSSLRELAELMITNCHLNDIKEGTFSGLIHLRELNLQANDLQIIRKGAFKGMKSRQESSMILNIGTNKIANIEDGTFEGANTIDHLFLSLNRLTALPNLRGISEKNSILRFDDNCISNISSLKKSGLKTITELSLFANKVSIMPLFKNIRILQELNFASNNIKEIPARFLDNSPTLNTLILNNNQIEKIHKDSFMGLQDLQELYLFNNIITKLPDGVFANLTLKNLFLNGNRLKKLTGRPFKGMKKTKTAIYFFGNDIQHIDNDYFNDLGNETMVDFRCKSLKDLPHIRRSSLSRITCAPNQLGWIRELNNQVAYSLARSGFFCNKTYSNNWNCIPCNVGSFQAKRENDPCSECSAGGFYQDEMAQTKCKECNIGTYVHPNNTPGATPLSCQACPQGTQTSDKAGYRACKCLPNFYRFDRFGRCFPCPSKSFKCENDYASLSAGFYWRWKNSTSKKQYRRFIENLKIKSPEFGEGTWRYEGTLPNPHKCPRDSCLGGLDSSCQTGYQGPLCALCEPDYYNKFNRCIRCPSRLWAGFQVAIVIVLFVVVLLALLWGDRKRLHNEHGRTMADKILSCFKIVIGFYQVMAGLYSAFSNIAWPSSVVWMQKTLHFIQLNILQIAPLSCITSRLSFNVLQQFVIVVALNITVVTIILIYLVIRMAILKRKKSYSQNQVKESVAKTKSSCIRNICVFLFAIYPKTCTGIIQVLSINCVQLCFEEEHTHCDSYLRSDLSVQCHTPKHDIYSRVATAFLLYPIGFPMVILILVWKYIHQPSIRKECATPNHLSSEDDDMPPCKRNECETPNYLSSEDDDMPPCKRNECGTPNHLSSEDDDMPPCEKNEWGTPNHLSSEDDDMPPCERNECGTPNHLSSEEVVVPANVDSPFKSGLSLFSENYRSNCWYWEALEMIRKLVLISGLTLIGEHSRTQIGLGAIISAVFAILYVYKRPITNKFENLLQTVALMAIFLNLGIGVMLKASDNDKMSPVVNKHNDDLGVSIMMIIINVAVIGIVTVAVVKVIIMQTLKCCRSANEDNCSCGHCCQACLRCCLSLLLPLKMRSGNFTKDDESRTALLQCVRNV